VLNDEIKLKKHILKKRKKTYYSRNKTGKIKLEYLD
jgi:hypothetical protein